MMEELQVVRSERDRAVREEKSLKQSVTLLEQEKEVWFTVHTYMYMYIIILVLYRKFHCGLFLTCLHFTVYESICTSIH